MNNLIIIFYTLKCVCEQTFKSRPLRADLKEQTFKNRLNHSYIKCSSYWFTSFHFISLRKMLTSTANILSIYFYDLFHENGFRLGKYEYKKWRRFLHVIKLIWWRIIWTQFNIVMKVISLKVMLSCGVNFILYIQSKLIFYKNNFIMNLNLIYFIYFMYFMYFM